MTLDGLTSLVPGDRIGAQARKYCQENIIQTEVDIETMSLNDKNGTFYVRMSATDAAHTNISVKILEYGFAEILPKLRHSNDVPQDLVDVQESAYARSQGIWSDKTRHMREIGMGTSYPVRVTSIYSPVQFVIQYEDQVMKTVNELCRSAVEPIKEIPMVNDCYVCRYKNKPYRVSIEKVDLSNKEEPTAAVNMIDFQQKIPAVPLRDLFELPPQLRSIPQQGRAVKLAGLKVFDKPRNEAKTDTEYIWSVVNEVILYMQVVFDEGTEPLVLLLDRENMDEAGCLGYVLIQKNIAEFVEGEYPPQFNKIFNQFRNLRK